MPKGKVTVTVEKQARSGFGWFDSSHCSFCSPNLADSML